jgi:ATP-dependent Clp protease ATP-binding subunit ClpA
MSNRDQAVLEIFLDRVNDATIQNEPQLYTSLAQHVVETTILGQLLKQKQVIQDALVEVSAVTRSENAGTRLMYGRPKNVQPSREFYEALRNQQRLLSIQHINEAVILLGCLQMLEQSGYSSHYRTILKDIISNNLHRIQLQLKEVPFFGREKERDTILRCLESAHASSILITGPEGIGKTALALNTLEHYIADTIDVYQLFPGSSDLIDQIITLRINSADRKMIFFVDDIFSFESDQIQHMIENVTVLSTANDSSYTRALHDNPGLIAKFKHIPLTESADDETRQILVDYAGRMNLEAAISWDVEDVKEIIELTKRYLPTEAFPAKAIRLMDESLAAHKKSGNTQYAKNTAREIVSQRTGIPLGDMNNLDKQDLSSLPRRLEKRVKGQPQAIAKVSQVIQRSRLGFGKKNRPVGSFLFVGPSGVGKTELVKAVAYTLFGDEEAMVRLDMSEYAEAHNVQRLIGAPPGYVGYEEGGQLTNPIVAKPHNVVLLDEIEKANPRVFDIFLQVLDDGRLTDGKGKLVDFRNTLVIATSNAGIEDMLDLIDEGKTTAEIETELKDILQDYFRIEFLNRFDGIVMFNTLQPEALQAIAKLQIKKLASELKKRRITLTVRDASIERIAEESYDPRYGARGLLRHLQDNVENRLAEMIISGDLVEGQSIEL